MLLRTLKSFTYLSKHCKLHHMLYYISMHTYRVKQTGFKSFKAILIKSLFGVSQGPSAPLPCLRVYVWSRLHSITVSSILYQCISKRAREPHRSESGSLPHSTYPRHLSSVSEHANTLHRWRRKDCKKWMIYTVSAARKSSGRKYSGRRMNSDTYTMLKNV